MNQLISVDIGVSTVRSVAKAFDESPGQHGLDRHAAETV